MKIPRTAAAWRLRPFAAAYFAAADRPGERLHCLPEGLKRRLAGFRARIVRAGLDQGSVKSHGRLALLAGNLPVAAMASYPATSFARPMRAAPVLFAPAMYNEPQPARHSGPRGSPAH